MTINAMLVQCISILILLRCSYHGVVDFMIYNSVDPNKLPLIPVVQYIKYYE